MKNRFLAAACATLLIAGLVASTARAQPEPSHVRLGASKSSPSMLNIQIRNFQDESLGRIQDLGVDLVNGRIVVVLVVTDGSLDVENQVVAVPPLALVPDLLNEVYRLDISVEEFRSAAAINLSKWESLGQTRSVAAAYHLFGQTPYFLEEGETASPTDSRPKVGLGYVERSSKLLDLPVGNLQDQQFGKVWSLNLNITQGRVLSVIVLAPGNFKTKSVIPPEALAFNPARNALLLDDTKLEYRDEPRFVFTDARNGQDSSSREEAYTGPHTSVALEQGTSYRDIDQTVRINRQIRAEKINGRHVQIGTQNERVTLRGWVETDADKARIGAIAIAAARLELVDNQIVVGNPAVKN